MTNATHPEQRASTMTHVKNFPVLSDSGVYQQGEGYERIVIVNNWHPAKPLLMARFKVRVDRVPSHSFATLEIWTLNSGWQSVGMIDHRDFWESMPGYLRWSRDISDDKTMGLIEDLADDLEHLALSIEV